MDARPRTLRARPRRLLDLNMPAIEIRELQGTSNLGSAVEEASTGHEQLIPPSSAVIDDDLAIASPTAFAQARNNRSARRIRPMPVIVDLESEEAVSAGNRRVRPRKMPPNQQVIDCDCIILESSAPAPVPAPPPPPPPQPTIFTCPVCLDHLTQEVTTKCGHIFCYECIKSAVGKQGKCPTCRKKVLMKQVIRVFLPNATNGV